MSEVAITPEETALIDASVQRYEEHKHLVRHVLTGVYGAIGDRPALQPFIHSMKMRLKDNDHLRDKLVRKLKKSKEKGTIYKIDPDSVLTTITDLAGVRILHLYTRQAPLIVAELNKLFPEYSYEVIEGPAARTWDNESAKYFKKHGIDTVDSSETMYTSVHYVLSSKSKTVVTCEVQVRTLMEEVWGEVDHTINYPHPVNYIPCTEQIRALARATSSASRLVDSIFASFEYFKATQK